MRAQDVFQNISLFNKAAIVTGGGSGIGRGIALALANEGSKVVVCGRRVEKLKETVDLIQKRGGEGVGIQCDISDEGDVNRLVKSIIVRYNRIDILVNNAGISRGTALHDLQIEDWDLVMDINLRGLMLISREVLPVMRAQRSGHIINISSESGIEYYKDDIAYGVSKHALNALGEFIQQENQDLNIRVNTICPGMVVTEMTEDNVGLNHSKCLYPQDIADLVIWLLTRRQNIKIGTPILIQTMINPWD